MKSKTIIRPSSPMDSVNIVRLLKAGYKESSIRRVSDLSEQMLLEYVTQTTKHAFSMVADMSGRVLGALALVPIRMPWTQSQMMAEAWFGVAEQFRSKDVAEQLLRAMDRFLDMNGLTCITGTNALVPTELDRFLEARAGYQPLRRTFLRLPNVQKAVLA